MWSFFLLHLSQYYQKFRDNFLDNNREMIFKYCPTLLQAICFLIKLHRFSVTCVSLKCKTELLPLLVIVDFPYGKLVKTMMFNIHHEWYFPVHLIILELNCDRHSSM
jgi:hypothetical protein